MVIVPTCYQNCMNVGHLGLVVKLVNILVKFLFLCPQVFNPSHQLNTNFSEFKLNFHFTKFQVVKPPQKNLKQQSPSGFTYCPNPTPNSFFFKNLLLLLPLAPSSFWHRPKVVDQLNRGKAKHPCNTETHSYSQGKTGQAELAKKS